MWHVPYFRNLGQIPEETAHVFTKSRECKWVKCILGLIIILFFRQQFIVSKIFEFNIMWEGLRLQGSGDLVDEVWILNSMIVSINPTLGTDPTRG